MTDDHILKTRLFEEEGKTRWIAWFDGLSVYGYGNNQIAAVGDLLETFIKMSQGLT